MALREKEGGKCPHCGAELKRMHPSHVTMCSHRPREVFTPQPVNKLTPAPVNKAPVNTVNTPSVNTDVNTPRWLPDEEAGEVEGLPITQEDWDELWDDVLAREDEIELLKAKIAEMEGKGGVGPKKSKGRPPGYHAEYMKKKRAAAKAKGAGDD